MRIFDEKEIYTTDPVDHIIKAYFKIIGISWKEFWKKLKILNLKIIFLLAIKDFKDKKISLDQLSTIANSLYYNDKIWTLFEINSADGKLGTALDMASELAYYNWRKKKNKSTMKLHQSALKIVEEYYKENKEVVRELSNNVQS